MKDRYEVFRTGITSTTYGVRDLFQRDWDPRGRVIAVHGSEGAARDDALRRNQADIMRRRWLRDRRSGSQNR